MIHWDYVCGILTAIGAELTGRKYWQGLLVGLVSQIFWLHLIFDRKLWGLLPLTALLTFQYACAIRRWRRDPPK